MISAGGDLSDLAMTHGPIHNVVNMRRSAQPEVPSQD